MSEIGILRSVVALTATDFYEWVAASARELVLLEKRKAALRMPKSSGMTASRHSGASDPTSRQALAAVSDEQAIQAGIDACMRVLDREREVTGMVASGFGQVAALALQLHYREGNSWQAISYELGLSLATTYRMRRTALEWVDTEGIVANMGKTHHAGEN